MTPSESILLPSQEALLLRLQHISLYGEQLILLMGEQGSGKTTLVTTLLDTLDEHSLALVTCPKHCDSHEIRRKILIQLLKEPIFDDELTLSESLLQVVDSLPESVCIVIDDADNMPTEMWGECLALSQLTLANTAISLVCTSDNHFLSFITEQLSLVQAEYLLPISIPPLSLIERQSLYEAFLSANGQKTFMDADSLYDKLSEQSGTPEEVLVLFELSLQNVPTSTAADPQTYMRVMPKWVSLILVVVVLSVVTITGVGLWMLKLPIDGQVNKAHLLNKTQDSLHDDTVMLITVEHQKNKLTASRKDAAVTSSAVSVSEVSEPQVKAVIEQDKSIEETADAQVATPSNVQAFSVSSPSQFATQAREKEEQSSGVIEQTPSLKPVTVNKIAMPRDSDRNQVEKSISVATNKNSLQVEKTAVDAAKVQPPIVWPTLLSVRPTQGYTLQLANVTKIETLYRLLTKIKGVEGLRIARYQQGWLVLVGEFDKKEFANKKSAYLIEKYKINKPWVRRWAGLSEYQLQVSVPSREIQ
ncbi:ATP-binding protein [uncultured Shewanella sp.]|uniref:AAA family ATPase n=1 Tax=uncultured Shewanella sp. TaxID=173975 RepID=UPI00261A19B0|nr:ATP-binding protein [uncultured Shewanella sp.]